MSGNDLKGWTRRRLMHTLGGAAGLIAMAPLSACSGRTRSGSDGTADEQPLAIPPLEQGLKIGGERQFDLTLQSGEKSFGGDRLSSTIGINAPYLGPTLQLRRGERVRRAGRERLRGRGRHVDPPGIHGAELAKALRGETLRAAG